MRECKNPCFNPCYCGYSSKSLFGFSLIQHIRGFNPCYCGYSSKSLEYLEKESKEALFQSLLLWIQLKKIVLPEVLVSCLAVSILVIVDIAQKVQGLRERKDKDEFQSLLLWIQLKKETKFTLEVGLSSVSILVIVDIAQKVTVPDDANLDMGCFNPCYCGYSSKSLILSQIISRLLQFQSLLLWIQLKK